MVRTAKFILLLIPRLIGLVAAFLGFLMNPVRVIKLLMAAGIVLGPAISLGIVTWQTIIFPTLALTAVSLQTTYQSITGFVATIF